MLMNEMVPSLMFATLGLGLLVLVVILVMFLRRRSNRHPMDDQPDRNVSKEIDRGDRGP